MQKVVVDTDLLSELLKGRNSAVLAKSASYLHVFETLTFTSLSTLEILSGLEHIRADARIAKAKALFSANEEIVPELEDFRTAAHIMGCLRRAGTPVGLIDPIIAACAVRRGFGVASGNTAHFDFIRQAGYDFHLENWRES